MESRLYTQLNEGDNQELKRICQNGGGFEQWQALLALKYLFREHQEVYIPSINDLAGKYAKLKLQELYQQQYQYVALPFAIGDKHQMGVWVILGESNHTVLMYDSLPSRIDKNTLLKTLGVGENQCEMIEIASPYKQQEDNWSCIVFTIAHLWYAYNVKLMANKAGRLLVKELAEQYYRFYKLQMEDDALTLGTEELNSALKVILCDVIERKRVEIGFYKNTGAQDVLKPFADYLQEIIWGNSHRGSCPDDNKDRENNSSEAEKVKPIFLMFSEYSNKKDPVGKFVLQIACLILIKEKNIDRAEFRNKITYLIVIIQKGNIDFIINQQTKPSIEKSYQDIQNLIATELDLSLNEVMDDKDKKTTPDDLLTTLFVTLLSGKQAHEIVEIYLKHLKCDDYFNQAEKAICYHSITLDNHRLIFMLLQITVSRMHDCEKIIGDRQSRMAVEQGMRAATQKMKIAKLRSIFKKGGVDNIDVELYLALAKNRIACQYLETYIINRNFFAGVDRENIIKWLKQLSTIQTNILNPFDWYIQKEDRNNILDFSKILIKYHGRKAWGLIMNLPQVSFKKLTEQDALELHTFSRAQHGVATIENICSDIVNYSDRSYQLQHVIINAGSIVTTDDLVAILQCLDPRYREQCTLLFSSKIQSALDLSKIIPYLSSATELFFIERYKNLIKNSDDLVLVWKSSHKKNHVNIAKMFRQELFDVIYKLAKSDTSTLLKQAILAILPTIYRDEETSIAVIKEMISIFHIPGYLSEKFYLYSQQLINRGHQERFLWLMSIPEFAANLTTQDLIRIGSSNKGKAKLMLKIPGFLDNLAIQGDQDQLAELGSKERRVAKYIVKHHASRLSQVGLFHLYNAHIEKSPPSHLDSQTLLNELSDSFLCSFGHIVLKVKKSHIKDHYLLYCERNNKGIDGKKVIISKQNFKKIIAVSHQGGLSLIEELETWGSLAEQQVKLLKAGLKNENLFNSRMMTARSKQ